MKKVAVTILVALFILALNQDNSAKHPHSVGQKQPNELGLYDMSGNAWEWCWDRFQFAYYKKSPRDNPRGPEFGWGD